jgi:hypothetical protein
VLPGRPTTLSSSLLGATTTASPSVEVELLESAAPLVDIVEQTVVLGVARASRVRLRRWRPTADQEVSDPPLTAKQPLTRPLEAETHYSDQQWGLEEAVSDLSRVLRAPDHASPLDLWAAAAAVRLRPQTEAAVAWQATKRGWSSPGAQLADRVALLAPQAVRHYLRQEGVGVVVPPVELAATGALVASELSKSTPSDGADLVVNLASPKPKLRGAWISQANTIGSEGEGKSSAMKALNCLPLRPWRVS